MALQNRVTPLGELVADPARGLVFGNRGCLHDDRGRIRRRYDGRRWIACRLSFRRRRRAPLMASGRYTELFFLDEATALAAGHRPCAFCRRADYDRLRAGWTGAASAAAIDARLHAERVAPGGGRRRHPPAAVAALPDGAFVVWDGAPHLVAGAALWPWTPGGYGAPRRRAPDAVAEVVTPPSLVALLRAGWDPVVPLIHPSARR
jgi:hypothetical protein